MPTPGFTKRRGSWPTPLARQPQRFGVASTGCSPPWRATAVGPLGAAVDHFRQVTRSYRPGLFACYTAADLPRTNNDLEQLFGSYRRHERRATGRKNNASATVLRGPVRIIASLATRLRRQNANDLAAADRRRWHELRASLERRRHARVLRAQFRRDSAAYLSRLEQLLCQPTLPF